jgi:protein tyrosine/serine phosphatase
MDSIFRGDLATPSGRRNAWIDALFVDHAVFRLINNNFWTVVPRRLYRSAHPTPGQLAAFTRAHGLKTLINLRGQAKNGSDALTREAAGRLGLAFVDAPLESRGAPQKDRILRLASVFETMAEPALVHCKSGADRAGLAAGLFTLAAGGTAREAMRQLHWRFGHIKQSRTGVLDAFFLLYATQGEARGKPFLDWVREDYDQVKLRADFQAKGLASFVNDRFLARE